MKRLLGRSIGRSLGRSIENEEIDRILSREGGILPSSGFAVSVMDAVRREASAPAPIPFPWKRALPGLVVGGLVLLVVLVVGIMAMLDLGETTPPQLSVFIPSGMPSIFSGGIQSAAIWTVLALLAAWVSVKLSLRLASIRL
jgi:hypothetical protein